jgi:4-nitrophenyl phosphatase
MPIAIFDMDGVLYRGAQVLPYARETLDRLRKANWDVFFATNNSTATRLVGLDLHLTYAKIAEAQRAILAGADFVCSNRDRAYPVEGRLLPGAGTIVAAIEVATGVKALCIGKPEPFLFQEAIRRAGKEADRVVVVGDSTDYDIVAAHRVGAVGVLITTGLTKKDALITATGEAVPDRVIHSLAELFHLPEFAGS